MKCARQYPFDVIAQARKDLGVIASVEAIDVPLDSALVGAHARFPEDFDQVGLMPSCL
jgi:hypothetical protein